MKRLFILSCLIVCITTIAHAQTYTQHLQEKTAGKGSVVVTQSEEIDKLVNTANVNPKQQEAANKPTQPPPMFVYGGDRTCTATRSHYAAQQ